MQWRHFAAVLNALICECSKRPQPTFTNTQRQRLHHILRGPLYSNENNNKLPQRQTVVQYLYQTQATGETRCVQRQIQESETCSGKGRQDRQGQIP